MAARRQGPPVPDTAQAARQTPRARLHSPLRIEKRLESTKINPGIAQPLFAPEEPENLRQLHLGRHHGLHIHDQQLAAHLAKKSFGTRLPPCTGAAFKDEHRRRRFTDQVAALLAKRSETRMEAATHPMIGLRTTFSVKGKSLGSQEGISSR